MNKQEIENKFNVDENRCKYCNSSYMGCGMMFCSQGYTTDMDCEGKDFTVDFNIGVIVSEQQLTNGWIPVSERLPDETGRYIVTYREWTDGNFLPKYDDTYVRIWRYRKDEQYTGFVYPRCCDAEAEKDTHREVLAWKIIEPYKEVSE